jgi:hypothetical protein
MNVQRVAIAGAVAVVALAVAAGLIVVGSPGEQRLLRLDERRINGLSQLSNRAEFHWNQERSLPQTAAELVDGRFLTRLPSDPVTREPLEYRVTGPRQFEVCATFDRPSRPHLAGDFWFHEGGRRCFMFEMTESSRP